MQCGAVVITSRDPAITEVAGGAAVQVDGSDSRGLVAALGAVADAPSSFAQVRERALERAAQFSWRTTAERTREVYDEARRRFRK